MEVRLIVAGGKNAGKAIKIPGAKFLIGRAEDCQLRPRSDLVSRHHCAIVIEDGYVAVRDFGSKNGTQVNGEKVLAEQELKTGDRLSVGTLEFDMEVTVEVAAQKKPEVRSVEEAASRTVESAQSAAGDDDGMDDWLGLDDDPSDVAGREETAVLSASETDTGGPTPDADPEVPAEADADEENNLRVDAAEDDAPEDDAPEDDAPEDDAPEDRGKRMIKAPKLKDTGDVAANLLQSFFKRRR